MLLSWTSTSGEKIVDLREPSGLWSVNHAVDGVVQTAKLSFTRRCAENLRHLKIALDNAFIFPDRIILPVYEKTNPGNALRQALSLSNVSFDVVMLRKNAAKPLPAEILPPQR